jgi:hypothetical protein
MLEVMLGMNQGAERSVRLMVNSRMDLGGGLAGADHIHLGPLPPADAQKLLMTHGGQDVVWEDGEALQLVEMCGCNALALTLVGGLLAARRCTPKACPHPVLLCLTYLMRDTAPGSISPPAHAAPHRTAHTHVGL